MELEDLQAEVKVLKFTVKEKDGIVLYAFVCVCVAQFSETIFLGLFSKMNI